jgi:hypothetical protein
MASFTTGGGSGGIWTAGMVAVGTNASPSSVQVKTIDLFIDGILLV